MARSFGGNDRPCAACRLVVHHRANGATVAHLCPHDLPCVVLGGEPTCLACKATRQLEKKDGTS